MTESQTTPTNRRRTPPLGSSQRSDDRQQAPSQRSVGTSPSVATTLPDRRLAVSQRSSGTSPEVAQMLDNQERTPTNIFGRRRVHPRGAMIECLKTNRIQRTDAALGFTPAEP
jgi:hypothetical protein